MLEIRGESLEVGSVIANAYRLERVVGQGGMGIVWAARDVRTGRVVALKFLREEREADMRNQERFLREARAAMAVMHPAVARVEAVLETNAGVPFLVMELLEGEPLRAVLERRGTLAPFEIARLLLPVVDAVLAAHAMGIVHRDLKPENVFLLRGSGAVRVLDFGIAKQLPRAGEPGAASLTSTGAILGTPIYMAPEQVFGDADLGPGADVWSLGIMIYEALTGHAPTEGDGFGPIIRRITTDPIAPLGQLRPDAPRRITGLVDRMLTRDRSRRAPLPEVRAVLASLAEGGENAPRSVRTAGMMPPISPRAPYGPSFGASTTQGVAGPPQAPMPLARPAAPSRAGLYVVVSGGVLLLASAVGTAVWFATHRSVVGGDPVATYNAAAKLQADAGQAVIARDGKTCTAKLDAFDAQYASQGLGLPSTDPKSQSASTRALCLMILGKCQEGEKLYRAFNVRLADASTKDIEQSVTTQTALLCTSDDLTPQEAYIRASFALMFASLPPGVKPRVADCPKLVADYEKRRAKLTPAQLASIQTSGGPDPLGTCTRTAEALNAAK